jgi:hypothetical protein
MNSHHVSTKQLFGCLAVCLFVVSQSHFLFGQRGQEWGKPENGVQMSLFHASETTKEAFRFRVEIRNVGSNDLLLNLGDMLANGRKQYPDAVAVLITNPKGETEECGFQGPSGVAGWVGPFVVPVPAGASFSLPIDLKKWTNEWKSCFAPRKYIELSLAPGKYALRVQLTGKSQGNEHLPPIPDLPPSTKSMEWGGQILFPVWIGTLISNQVEFELASPFAGK